MHKVETLKLALLFYQSIEKLNLNNRYEHLTNGEEDLSEILNNFLLIMSNKEVKHRMLSLQKHDEASFIHSFDMFVLASVIELNTNVFDFQFLNGAFLHDVGKLKISKEILQKNGKLTDEEHDEIKKHTLFGYDILSSLNLTREAELAKSHHERMDGTGYPNAISNKNIDHDVRLLSIMDVYSALTLARPYKPAFSNEKAFNIMLEDAHFFDKELLEGFMLKIAQDNFVKI